MASIVPTRVFESELGPLIDQAGKCLPFAPLLRTRETLPYGIIRSSWTLYQPHALVWNYAFWNGQINFGKACRLEANKIPHLKWKQIVPPPFLKAWFRFLQLCENQNMQGKEIDEALAPLLPLFHCDNYCLPFRILKEKEVASPKVKARVNQLTKVKARAKKDKAKDEANLKAKKNVHPPLLLPSTPQPPKCENHARKMRTFFTRRLEPKTKSSNAFKWSLRPKRK